MFLSIKYEINYVLIKIDGTVANMLRKCENYHHQTTHSTRKCGNTPGAIILCRSFDNLLSRKFYQFPKLCILQLTLSNVTEVQYRRGGRVGKMSKLQWGVPTHIWYMYKLQQFLHLLRHLDVEEAHRGFPTRCQNSHD